MKKSCDWRINYKNGNSILTKAISLELHDGELFGLYEDFYSNSSVWYVIDATFIESVEKL